MHQEVTPSVPEMFTTLLFKSSHWPWLPSLRLLTGWVRHSNDPSIIYTVTKWATFDKDIITVQKGLWRVGNIKHHDTSHIFHYFMSGSIAGLQAAPIWTILVFSEVCPG